MPQKNAPHHAGPLDQDCPLPILSTTYISRFIFLRSSLFFEGCGFRGGVARGEKTTGLVSSLVVLKTNPSTLHPAWLERLGTGHFGKDPVFSPRPQWEKT